MSNRPFIWYSSGVDYYVKFKFTIDFFIII